jgi:predicted nucleotide-binding protein (sugar kinase/HSP70/actin superfamily)
METIRIKKSIITKVGADLAKEYANDANNYKELIREMWRDDAPYDAVEEYLIDEGVMDSEYDLKDYVSASDYIDMMKVAQANRKEYFVATDFEANFKDWFCNELEERLQYYNFDLDAPVDVDAMVRMADDEKNKGR